MLFCRNHLCWLVIAYVALGGLASKGLAQTLLAPTAPFAVDPFAIGMTLATPNTLRVSNLDELIAQTAGGISDKAFSRHTFGSYWDASASSRSGKSFEAITVFHENKRLAALGSDLRLAVTAVEGNPSHAADILVLDGKGRVVGHFQAKLGWKNAMNALTDPKYVNMTILIPTDEMEIVKRELARKRAAAMRRGIPLDPKFRGVEQAIQKGRLTDQLPSGAKALTRKDITQVTKQQTGQVWQEKTPLSRSHTARPSGATSTPQTAERTARAGSQGGKTGGASAPKYPKLKVLGRAVGGALVVVNVGTMGYYTYGDVMRYRADEIGAGYLGVKVSMRSVQTGLILYLYFAPDPSLATKVIAGGAVIVLMAADTASDYVYEAQREQARRLLETIDRDERFYAARKQLRDSMK